eukprot:TRINITY_DN1712_c0_g1_i7.p1 TRINITY_DN1712_c0_g1~~TRINITY_DN1712_c0_g1_i7.p1  ORF type:complete len:762 (-),score=166.13 TRINITY_DN1712_c0_g1_i7:554-2839(-)
MASGYSGRDALAPSPMHLDPLPSVSPGPSLLSPRRGRQQSASPFTTHASEHSGLSDPTVAPEGTRSTASYVRGHVIWLTVSLYLIMFIILLSSEVSGWVPRIRFYNFVPYFVLSVTCVQVMRFFRAAFPDSPVPLFLNIMPGAFLIVASREAHIVIALVFLVGVLVTHTQTGTRKLRYYIIFFIVCYVLVYAVCVIFIHFFYIDTQGTDLYKGVALTQDINVGEEVTFALSMMAIGVGFFTLIRFIDDYAVSLAVSDSKVSRLALESFDLMEKVNRHSRELRATEARQDASAPIEKVISILSAMRSDEQCNNPDSLDYVLDVLNSNQLYDPSFDQDRVTTLHDRHMGLAASVGGHNPMDVAAAAPAASGAPHLLSRATSDGNILRKGNAVREARLDAADILKSGEAAIENHLNAMLERVDHWDFDIFQLSHLTGGKALYVLAMTLFDRYGILERYQIKKHELENFLRAIQSGYRVQNLYHNSIHSANMLQAMHYILIHGDLAHNLTELEIFAVLVSVIIIDYNHPGLNNDYQIESETALAWKYNDISPLEMNSASAAFEQMRKKNQNILQGLDFQERRQFREWVIKLVLASDRRTYYEAISKFRLRVSRDKPFPFDINDRRDLAAIAVRVVLMSNYARPRELMMQWVDRHLEEGFRQGDLERRAGRECSVHKDRAKTDKLSSQLPSIELSARLFEAASTTLDLEHILEIFDSNRSVFEFESRTMGQTPNIDAIKNANSLRRNSAPGTKVFAQSQSMRQLPM